MQTSLKELTTLVVILIPERSNITYIYDGYFMGYYLVQSTTKVTENYANCQGKIFLSSASNKFYYKGNDDGHHRQTVSYAV